MSLTSDILIAYLDLGPSLHDPIRTPEPQIVKDTIDDDIWNEQRTYP